MELIKHMVVNVLGGIYDSAEIFYEDGTRRYIDGFENVSKAISQFSMETGMDVRDLMRDDTKIAYVKVMAKPEETSVETESYVEEKENKEEVSNSVIVIENKEEPKAEEIKAEKPKTESMKKFAAKEIIKLTAGVLAIVTLASGITYSLVKKKFTSEPKNNKQTYDGFSVSRNSGSANNTYNANLDKTYSNVTEYLERSTTIVKNEPISEKEFFDTLNETNQIIFSGVEELKRFINGSRMQGNIYNMALQEMFAQDSDEYKAVEKFSNMRNNILNNAKNNQNRNATKNEIRDLINLYVDFGYGAGKLAGTNIQYYDLNDMARYIILGIGSAYSQIDVDYSKSMNGLTYDRNFLMSDSQEILNVMMQDMELRIRRR